MSATITTPELKSLTGCKRMNELESCLRDNGVRFLYGKNGTIYTTVDALNAAMGLTADAMPIKQDEPIEIL